MMFRSSLSVACFMVYLTQAKLQEHPVRHEIVQKVKEANTSWTPKEVEENHLAYLTIDQLENKMGNLSTHHETFVSKFANKVVDVKEFIAKALFKDQHLLKKSLDEDEDYQFPDGIVLPDDDMEAPEELDTLPDHWDWREHMPECLGEIEDQEICGACWAFASAGMLSDRFCIHSKGQIKTRLSPQEMVDCDYENFGCQGGYLLSAIDYLQVEGTVPRDCLPYDGETNWCSFRCLDENMPYEKHYCKVGSLVIATNYEQMKRNVYEKGPMMVGLMMYEDFMSYSSGIYKHIAGGPAGGHAMKLVGWGTDPEEGLFWILQNQWSKDWGEDGFIRIKHGEIGIDAMAMACDPDLI